MVQNSHPALILDLHHMLDARTSRLKEIAWHHVPEGRGIKSRDKEYSRLLDLDMGMISHTESAVRTKRVGDLMTYGAAVLKNDSSIYDIQSELQAFVQGTDFRRLSRQDIAVPDGAYFFHFGRTDHLRISDKVHIDGLYILEADCSGEYGTEFVFVSNAALREDARSTSIGELLRSFSCTASVFVPADRAVEDVLGNQAAYDGDPTIIQSGRIEAAAGIALYCLHAYKRSQEVGYHDCADEEDSGQGLCGP